MSADDSFAVQDEPSPSSRIESVSALRSNPEFFRPDLAKAVADAQANDDPPTLFFIHVTTTLYDEALQLQKDRVQLVQSFYAWLLTLVEADGQKHVVARRLPKDGAGRIFRAHYCTKALDLALRSVPW